MDYFPAFLRLTGEPCLIVGGGGVARRKAQSLLAAGASITLVAPDLIQELAMLVQQGSINYKAQCFDIVFLPGQRLVVAATNDPELNRHIALQAKHLGIWVDVVDNPVLSSYITPAMIDRSPITVAVSTSGASPVLARIVCRKIANLLPENVGAVAQFTAQFRDKIKARFQDAHTRRLFWESLLESPLIDLFVAGDTERLRRHMEENLAGLIEPVFGSCSLIGVGSGDVECLTVKALRRLEQADIVLYDKMVEQQLLTYARQDALCTICGDEGAYFSPFSQNGLTTIREWVQQNKRVVYLKKGNPFTFSGIEYSLLQAADIVCEILPGIVLDQDQ